MFIKVNCIYLQPLITIGSIEDIEKTDVINKEKPTNDNEKKEKFPCQKCQRVFEKEKARDLHMKREHNTKPHQYTPGLAKRKVGRPTTRFTCAECKNNLGNDFPVVLSTKNQFSKYFFKLNPGEGYFVGPDKKIIGKYSLKIKTQRKKLKEKISKLTLKEGRK